MSNRNQAVINWISGPVLRAHTRDAFTVYEAVLVGVQALLGEVIRIEEDLVVVQVYEDTSGMRPGDVVVGTGMPLSVKLGPYILGHIFDGLLRPLHHATDKFIGPGMRSARPARFMFEPGVNLGQQLTPGASLGTVRQDGGHNQVCLLAPDVSGTVTSIKTGGTYLDNECIAVLEDAAGRPHEIHMNHWWSIRKPRPVSERQAATGPLFTGQRILDSLFPIANGGRAAMPGGFGTGKTILQETLAKWCDADVIIYVGCGERGNEMAGVLAELPTLEDPRTGRPLMERTVIIANTSNMPVAAREASIYTGVTVAEYFRDQGLRVALMADSTSRWAEALREVSGRLGELPSEAGYPAYLSSRLAEFYERAAQVRTLGGATGALSIIGAVSPPSADFSEPVTTHTKRYVRAFWALDATRAQARFYPAIHPLQSYSGDIEELVDFWRQHDHPHWLQQRRRFLTILEQQSHLERMARIVGKDALPPRQQHILLCADIINDAFLRQSAFSDNDRYCSPQRQSLMMQLIDRFIDLTLQVIDADIPMDAIYALPVLRRLRRMNEDIDDRHLEQLRALSQDLEAACAQLRQRSHADET